MPTLCKQNAHKVPNFQYSTLKWPVQAICMTMQPLVQELCAS